MRTAVSDAKLYELVELIYSAAQSPEHWQTFVTRFGEAVSGVGAALMVRSESAEAGIFIVHSMFSPGAIPEFLRDHADSTPWVRVLRAVETGAPFATEDHVPLASIKGTPFYKNLLKPHKIGGCIGVKLWDRADGRAVFVATAPEDQLGAAKLRLFPILERLAPHLNRSLALSWALHRERAKGLEDGLARQADAVFVLNNRGEIIFMNGAAQRGVQEGIVRVAPVSRKLGLVSRKENAAFTALLKSAGSSAAELAAPVQRQIIAQKPGEPGEWRGRLMTFTCPGTAGPNLIEILALPGAAASTIASIFRDRAREPHTLVMVRRRGGLAVPSIEDIRTVFGLSQKECEVTLALVEGQSVEDYAKGTGVAVDTVRWHLKNIYRRTECSNQAGLVRLVLSLVGRANLG